MAQGFKFLFFLLLMACLGSGSAVYISLPSYHNETSTAPPGGRAKVFPGQLILPELKYKEQMNDTLSEEFLNGSLKIIDWLGDVFNDSAGYLESKVLKLEENKPQSRFWSRAENGVIATVDIIFDTTAVITTEEVKGKIENFTCTNCTLSSANFTSGDLCKNDSRYPCDLATTANCTSEDGSFTCTCREGYIPVNNSDTTCIGEGSYTTQAPPSTSPDPDESSTANSTQPSTTLNIQTSSDPDENSTTTSTQPSTTLNPCGVNSCGQGSTCQPRADQTFVCLCLAGDWYDSNSKSCEKAKVFPGQLILPEFPYEAQMNDTLSAAFLNGSKEIIDWLRDVFNNSAGYLESTVLKLEENKPQSRFWSRAENGVNATVDIIFDTTAVITTEEVKGKIENFTFPCTNCTLSAANFRSGDLCKEDSRYPCDEVTTTCSSKDGSYNCSCIDGYFKTNFGDRMCVGCPSGQKFVDFKCVNCPFGRSGLNCNESWKLILVIVGSILGGLLLITLILLPVVAGISSKKSSKKNKNSDMGNPNLSKSAAEALLVKRGLANSQTAAVNGSANAFSSAGLPKIPRATTPSSRDRTNLEMTPRNSRQNLNPVGRNSRLYRDEDDFATYGNTSDRPHNNPNAQRQPQIDPYTSRQGQSNPSYIHDDGRRFDY